MLNKLLEHNDQVVLTPSALTRFHSRAPPGISVVDYLKRIVRYTNLEVSLTIVLLLLDNPLIFAYCTTRFLETSPFITSSLH
jgi:hypothetical protein